MAPRKGAQRIASAAKSVGKKLGKAASQAADWNDDGKVDQEDARLISAKAKQITSRAADSAGGLAKEAAKHDMVKDAAAGAAIGAAVGIPIPVIGPVAGAAIGAIAGVARNLKSAGEPKHASPSQEIQAITVRAARTQVPRCPARNVGAWIRRRAPCPT